MPGRTDESTAGSLGVIFSSLASPDPSFRDADLTLLKNVLGNPVIKSLIEVQDTVETFNGLGQPVSCDNLDLVREIIIDIDRQQNKSLESRELSTILKSPYFKSLIEAHDDVGSKNYEPGGGDAALPALNTSGFLLGVNGFVPDEQTLTRMIGIQKSEEEPLGITVKLDDAGVVVVSRVLEGSSVYRQGLLHVGDIVKEVNGQEVTDPNQLTNMLKKINGTVTFKVLPCQDENVGQQQMYLKALFDYEPSKDKLIPSREAGLTFKHGDILQVVSMSDPHWWQARKVDSNGLSGLIPSRMLEERRKAFVKPELDMTRQSLFCGLVTRKKRKVPYTVTKHADFDRAKIVTYEEVHRMPPFTRKLLVLVGARGTGRRTLKNMLVTRFPKRFGTTIPYTSRQALPDEVNGEQYHFVTPDQIEQDILQNQFIEYGQHEGNWYGTKFSSIREIINSGRMCAIDLNPQALKQIMTPEFQPYVVFIAAPSVDVMRAMSQLAYQHYVVSVVKTEKDLRDTLDSSKEIERLYKHYFDMTIVNDNMEDTLNKLLKTIETFNTEPQWVPISWVL